MTHNRNTEQTKNLNQPTTHHNAKLHKTGRTQPTKSAASERRVRRMKTVIEVENAGAFAPGCMKSRKRRRARANLREAQLDDGTLVAYHERRTKDGGYVRSTDITRIKESTNRRSWARKTFGARHGDRSEAFAKLRSNESEGGQSERPISLET